MGTQDDLAYARSFVERTGTSFTMLWSDSFASWDHFNVSRNSSVLLLDSSARLVDDKAIVFDAAAVTEQLGQLA